MAQTTMQTAIALAMSFGLAATGWAMVLPAANSSFEPAPAGMSAPGAAAHSQGYLGVDIRDIGDDQIAALKLKESRGAEVIHVDHDGPAGKAGLREHDVILQMNGQIIEGEEQLRRMLREIPAGRTVSLLLSRDGQQITVTTQLADRLEVEREAWQERWVVPQPAQDGVTSGAATAPQNPGGNANAQSSSSTSSSGRGQSFLSPGTVAHTGHSLMGVLSLGSSYTGAMVETMGPQLAEFFGTDGAGVLVHSVDANSPAAAAGLRAGDVVLRANSVRMATSGDWMKIVRENRGKRIEVVVLRDKKEQTLTMVPDGKKRSSIERPFKDPPIVMARLGFALR